MRAESSLLAKAQGSFGETSAAARDRTRAGRARMRWAVALLVLGVLVAFVPGLMAGDGFLSVVRFSVRGASERAFHDEWLDGYLVRSSPVLNRFAPGTSAISLVRRYAAWTVVAISLALVPAVFGWWRRAGIGFARPAGIACAVAASASVIALVASMRGLSNLPGGVWWTVPVGGALMAAAFVVAPTPRVRDE